jgi:eukaryotic-like serine/threonine-protein kinase
MKNIKFISLFLTCLFILSACSFSFGTPTTPSVTTTPTAATTPSTTGQIDQTIVPAGFSEYSNTTYGFKMYYPTDWDKKDNYSGTAFMALSQLENDQDMFAENVNIVTEDLPSSDISIEEYKDASLEQIQQGIENYNMAELNKTTFAGKDAYKVIYTGTSEGYNFKWMQVFAINGSTAYVFTYTADPNGFSKFLPIVEQMLNSFKFL